MEHNNWRCLKKLIFHVLCCLFSHFLFSFKYCSFCSIGSIHGLLVWDVFTMVMLSVSSNLFGCLIRTLPFTPLINYYFREREKKATQTQTKMRKYEKYEFILYSDVLNY